MGRGAGRRGKGAGVVVLRNLSSVRAPHACRPESTCECLQILLGAVSTVCHLIPLPGRQF